MSQHTTRRRVIALATACVLSLGLAACGKSPTPDASASSDTSAVTGKTVRVWFMEGSISDDAIAYLEKTFAEQNPGNTLKVEIQPWDGIVSKLQTSLASKSESPDLVETGNTQTAHSHPSMTSTTRSVATSLFSPSSMQGAGITSFTHFRCMRALAELSTVRIFSRRPISLSRRASMSWQTRQSSWVRPTPITSKDSPACTCRQWISTVSNP